MKQLHLDLDDEEYQAFQLLRASMGFKYDRQCFRAILDFAVRTHTRQIEDSRRIQRDFAQAQSEPDLP